MCHVLLIVRHKDRRRNTVISRCRCIILLKYEYVQNSEYERKARALISK